jgi:hypothetical protein
MYYYDRGILSTISLSMYNMYPHVPQMQIHLPGMHMVPFNDTDSLEEVAAHAISQ